MQPWRQIIGVLALAMASAGPLPLWLHHAVSHGPAGLCCAHAHDSAAEPSSTCSHSHSATEAVRLAASSQTEASTELSRPEHECVVCYQLSQSASVAWAIELCSQNLLPTATPQSIAPFLATARVGLYAPRGPPAV